MTSSCSAEIIETNFVVRGLTPTPEGQFSGLIAELYKCGDTNPCLVYTQKLDVVQLQGISVSPQAAQVNEDVIFTAQMSPTNSGGSILNWSGGGQPATGTGTVFTTHWSTPGTHTVTAYCGINECAGTTSVNVPVVKVNLDVNRKNGTLVPEDKEHSNGSIVQIVPKDNPSTLYPNGIFLGISTMTVEPASVASALTLKLKKVGPSTSVGKIRVWKNGSMFMNEGDMVMPVVAADLSSTWKVDSTMGGVVDLALIAEYPAGTELCRDTIRISSIPCEPGDGAIIFVNPALTVHTSPYDDFEKNGAEKIADALAPVAAGAGDNIVVARQSGTYDEYDIAIGPTKEGVVLAGAAGKWTVDDPADPASPIHPNPYATVFDFAELPTVKGAKGQSALLGTFMISADGVVLGGLRLISGSDSEFGGGIIAANLSGLLLCYSAFDDNTSPIGGAVNLLDVANGKINTCLFDGNIAEFHDNGTPTLTKGFGGAVATGKSSAGNADLAIVDCLFGQITGNKALTTSTPGGIFTTGSASGGGDIYLNQGRLSICFSQFQKSRAGKTMPASSTYVNLKQINKFTGDGGSIAVHGNQDDTQVTITDAKFENTRAEGDGGAIYIAKDADPANRALITAYSEEFVDRTDAVLFPTPEILGGGCAGSLTRVAIKSCLAGSQGGGMFLCGREVQVTIDGCKFSECKAGVVHQTDGKGGAIAFGGGHQGTWNPFDDSPISHVPHGKMTIHGNTLIEKCTSSDNGGGIYLTISGEIAMSETQIKDCDAFGSQGISGHVSMPDEEGLGGGAHVTAGGMLRMGDGCVVSANRARFSGGGLGCKNGLVEMSATGTGIYVRENRANEHTDDGGGYGGGIYLSTAANDGGWPVWLTLDGLLGRGKLVVEDGSSGSTQRRITINGNYAKEWGGGLYGGVPAVLEAYCEVAVNCLFSMNICGSAGANSPYNGLCLYPNEVVGHVQDGIVNLKTSHINGAATAIGLYLKSAPGIFD